MILETILARLGLGSDKSSSRKQSSDNATVIDEIQDAPATSAEEAEQTAQKIAETEACDDADFDFGTGFEAACAQTIGAREDQEDSCWVSDWKDSALVERFGLAAVVADGIGGIDDGQLASGAAIRAIAESFTMYPHAPTSGRLLAMAAAAQRSVLALNRNSRCGSTLVAVLIHNRRMDLVSIGDSRIYLYRHGTLLQLNRAHELGKDSDESSAFGWGHAETDAHKRKALTAYLGKENLRQIDRTIHPLRLIAGDRVLLMSDGVFGTLTEDEILSCVQPGAAETARTMILTVVEKKRPGQDNATVAVVEVK